LIYSTEKLLFVVLLSTLFRDIYHCVLQWFIIDDKLCNISSRQIVVKYHYDLKEDEEGEKEKREGSDGAGETADGIGIAL